MKSWLTQEKTPPLECSTLRTQKKPTRNKNAPSTGLTSGGEGSVPKTVLIWHQGQLEQCRQPRHHFGYQRWKTQRHRRHRLQGSLQMELPPVRLFWAGTNFFFKAEASNPCCAFPPPGRISKWYHPQLLGTDWGAAVPNWSADKA